MIKCNGVCYVVGTSSEYCSKHVRMITKWEAISKQIAALPDADAAALCRYLGGYFAGTASAIPAFESGLRRHQTPTAEQIKGEAEKLYRADITRLSFSRADKIAAHGLGVSL